MRLFVALIVFWWLLVLLVSLCGSQIPFVALIVSLWCEFGALSECLAVSFIVFLWCIGSFCGSQCLFVALTGYL